MSIETSNQAAVLTALDDLAGQVAAVVAAPELAEAISRRLMRAHAAVELVQVPSNEPMTAESAYFRGAVETIVATHGRLDIWIQSAHTEVLGPSADIGLDAWWQGLAESAGTAFAGAQAAGRLMCERGSGTLVFVTSVDGLLASAGRAAPACGAAAIMALVRTLACEWAPIGIRINAIATPQWLDKPRGLAGLETTAAGFSPTRIPLGRPICADEVAESVLYLASAQASFVTGETLRLDGGWAGYHLF